MTFMNFIDYVQRQKHQQALKKRKEPPEYLGKIRTQDEDEKFGKRNTEETPAHIHLKS